MHIVEEFKGEALRGIFSHAKKLFVPVIGLLVLVGVAMVLIVGFGVKAIFSEEFFETIRSGMEGGTSSEQMQELILYVQEYMQNLGLNFKIMLYLFMLIPTIIFAWFVNYSLHASKELIYKGETSMSSALSKSFGSSLSQVIIIAIVLSLANNLISEVIALIGASVPALQIVLSLVVSIFFIRFFAAQSAAVHGDMKAVDAIKNSYKDLTWKRALILFLGGLVAAIVLILLFVFVALILAYIPVAGPILIALTSL
ncbi:MAG: hypothetical protein ACI9NN_001911, partial [Bacteroidia bacterium]